MAVMVMWFAVQGIMLVLGSALLISWGHPVAVLLGLFAALGGFSSILVGFRLGASDEENSSDKSEEFRSETVREVRTEVVREFYVRDADGSLRLEGRVIDGNVVDSHPVPAPRQDIRTH